MLIRPSRMIFCGNTEYSGKIPCISTWWLKPATHHRVPMRLVCKLPLDWSYPPTIVHEVRICTSTWDISETHKPTRMVIESRITGWWVNNPVWIIPCVWIVSEIKIKPLPNAS